MKFIAALAIGVLLQPGPAADPDTLVRDIGTLAAAGSPDARFEALTALLKVEAALVALRDAIEDMHER